MESFFSTYGKFFLIDILQSETGLEGMLLEH